MSSVQKTYSMPIYSFFHGDKNEYSVLEIRYNIPRETWQDFLILRIRTHDKQRASAILRLPAAVRLYQKLASAEQIVRRMKEKKWKEVKLFQQSYDGKRVVTNLEIVARLANNDVVFVVTITEKRGENEVKLSFSLDREEMYAFYAAVRRGVDKIIDEISRLLYEREEMIREKAAKREEAKKSTEAVREEAREEEAEVGSTGSEGAGKETGAEEDEFSFDEYPPLEDRY